MNSEQWRLVLSFSTFDNYILQTNVVVRQETTFCMNCIYVHSTAPSSSSSNCRMWKMYPDKVTAVFLLYTGQRWVCTQSSPVWLMTSLWSREAFVWFVVAFCRILGFRKKPWFLQHVLYSWQDKQSFLQWPQSHAHVRPISFSLQVAMVCCMTANWPWSLKEGEKWCRRWMSVHVSWHMQLKDVRLIGKKQTIYQGQCTCSTSCDVLHLHQTFPKSGQWFLTLASLMNCYHY